MDWWIIITIIMNAISFILNGLFLFVLARNKDLVKRKRITYHVANIAVADTLYSEIQELWKILASIIFGLEQGHKVVRFCLLGNIEMELLWLYITRKDKAYPKRIYKCYLKVLCHTYQNKLYFVSCDSLKIDFNRT